jgi:RNA-directed DNA polymerase
VPGLNTPEPVFWLSSATVRFWHRAVERYWHKMLCSRSRHGYLTWEVFQQIKARLPSLRPKLYLPYRELQALAVL